MSYRAPGEMIRWYRCYVSKEDLAKLNQRSDIRGFIQTFGYLGFLAATGTTAYYSCYHWPWYATVALVFFHGACWNFMINGFHELIHDSVFKTRALNRFFLWIFSFLGKYSHVAFWASHTEHHKFTLHPPDDLEVVLPQKYTFSNFWKGAFINFQGPKWFIKENLRIARGKLSGQWETHLFADNPKEHKKLIAWAKFLLIGHLALAITFVATQQWILLALVTFAGWYAGALHFFCNASQHVGLSDNVPDFRLCCRTIYLNPFFQFLYWHMNYHTEHHMFAAVPCYNLPKLHRLIKPEMPPCPNGLYATWKHIIGILKRQEVEPDYKYVPELPPRPAQAEKTAPAVPEAKRVETPVAEPVLS